MEFWGYFLFVSEKANIPLSENVSIEQEIVRQQIPSAPMLSMESVAQVALWTVVFTFIFRFALHKILESLLIMIQTLIIMAHTMLIDVWYPENVQKFFSEIFALLAFDMIPTEYFYP